MSEFDIAVIGAGASAEAFLRGLGRKGGSVAVIAPLRRPVAKSAGFRWPKDASPKLLNEDLRASVNDWFANLSVPFRQSDHFTYLGFSGNGGTRFWGQSIGAFDEEDLSALGLAPARIANAYADVAGFVPVAGNRADDLRGNFEMLPASDLPFRSDEIALLDGVFAEGRLSIGAARNAVSPAIPRGRCDGCGLCLDLCDRGALWSADIAPVADARANLVQVDGWVRELRQIPSGFELSVFEGVAGATTEIRARCVVLAMDPLATFALLARFAGEGAEARFHNAPALAWMGVKLKRSTAAGSIFGLAHSQVLWRAEGRTEAFGHIFSGVALTKSAARLLPYGAIADRLFRAALPNMLLGNLYFRGPEGGHRLLYRNGEVLLETVDPRLPEFAGDAMRDLKATLASRGVRILVTRKSFPGTDIHYAGGLPTALRGEKTHHTTVPGLYVLGGAAFSHLPPQSPTFTFMAAALDFGKTFA